MKNEFDRIIIGGGAAGLFAAGWAAQNGERIHCCRAAQPSFFDERYLCHDPTGDDGDL